MRKTKIKRKTHIENFLEELTPEKIEEMRLKRLEHIKSMTAEYQLGIFVGDYIVTHFLPTLSTDMLQSRKVIKVSEDDEIKYKELHDGWYRKYNDKTVSEDEKKEAWDIHLAHMKEMDRKYLPHILECHLPVLNITNMKEFKKGIMVSLWDCDMCNYHTNEDDIDISTDDHGYFTNIKLKLDA
jgi:hypothetical protein